METKIIQIQTAVFTKNFNIPNDLDRATLLTEINTHSGTIFNGQPTLLPIPNDAPQEIPRYILNSSDGKFGCNIALSRTDIFYKIPTESTENFEQLLEVHRNNAENIFTFLLSKGIVINRIGFIVTAEKILSSGEGTSLDYLRSNFIREDKLNTPKELTLNYNRSSRSENFEMNNLITLSAKAVGGISMQTDINTIPEMMSTANFNLQNFVEIVDHTIQETKLFVDDFPNI